MKKLMLIDGNSLLFRMFYGIRDMSNSKGVPTNALYGFVNILYKIDTQYHPDALAVAFDLPEPTFRHQKYDEYKAGREKMPEDLLTQLPLIKKLLERMGISVLSQSGYEADDIIGTVSRMGEERDMTVEIITGDRDSFQLVSERVHILYTTTRSGNQFTVVDPAYIDDKYGVTPKELIEVKALMGDTSDNIPGIKGIGEKTALKLIAAYHNIDTLYDHTDDLKGKQKERIVTGKDDAYLSRFLGEIDRHVPLEISLDDLKIDTIFTDEAIELLKEWEFRAILNKLDKPSEQTGDQARGKLPAYQTVDGDKELNYLLTRIGDKGEVILTTCDDGTDLRLVLDFGGGLYYINQTSLAQSCLHRLADLPNADDISIIGHDLKKLSHLFGRNQSAIGRYGDDIYVAAYLLAPSDNRYDLKTLAAKYLDMTIDDDEEFFGKGKSRVTIAEKSEGDMAAFMIRNADVTAKLSKDIPARVGELGMTKLYETIELPLISVLSDMESEGFKIDLEALKDLSAFFEKKINALTDEIYDLAGKSFNINSTKQLGVILFEELGLPVIKKTKTGYSTSVDVLEELRPYHAIIDKILEYRTVSKLDSTYGQGLIKLVDPRTEKIYSHFNQTVTATGRISSSDPNLQNIPVKTELGREIRRGFIPERPDRYLVDADYSQVELRVLAHLSGDENLIEAFIEEQDIHTRTASEIFSVPMAEVTPIQRSRAKAINFGLIYGKQAFSLGKELGISRGEAQNYIDRYFERYPGVSAYMDNIKQLAKEKGYVTTLWGRRRDIPEIKSRNRMLVQSGERMALNTPIQGTAADIMKLAMIRVDQALKAESLDARVVLQVHDELIIDSSDADKEKVLGLLVREMENAAELKVPLIVDAHIGKSWYDIK